MQNLAKRRRLGSAVKSGWFRLINAARPYGRFPVARRRQHSTLPMMASASAGVTSPSLDPVALTILAVNRLGPATLRTAANGKTLTVAVPDARVGEIFRAALLEMQKARRTDRLVEIVVHTEAPEPAERLGVPGGRLVEA